MPKYKQKLFKGLLVGADNTDISPEKTPDCSNVVVSIPGELSNMEGTEKQVTSGFVDSVLAVHELDGNVFILEGDQLWLLP